MSPIARWALKQYLAYMFFIGAFILSLGWLITKWKRKFTTTLNMWVQIMSFINVWWRIWTFLVMHNLSGILLMFMTVAVGRGMKFAWNLLQNCLCCTDHSGRENSFYKLALNLNCFKRRYKWNHWINLHRIVYERRDWEIIVSFGQLGVMGNLLPHFRLRVKRNVGYMIKRIINRSRRK